MDREKVIKGLECCCSHVIGMSCGNCPYEIEQGEEDGISICTSVLGYDALALLKEQEEKKGQWIYKKYDDMFMCSRCEKYSIRNNYPYCHWCGAKMEVGEVNEIHRA